jgi:hypothetical protein
MGVEEFKNIKPISEEQIKKEIIFLKGLFFSDYTDEIPNEVIHNTGDYKCRAAWWSLLNASVIRLDEIHNILPSDMVKKLIKFWMDI